VLKPKHSAGIYPKLAVDTGYSAARRLSSLDLDLDADLEVDLAEDNSMRSLS